MALIFDKKTSRQEIVTIAQIAKRAKACGYPDDQLTINMDITAAHLDCPLRLQELLDADNSDFAHDVFGIRRFINRQTGKLDGCFVPRFAA